MSSSKLSSLQVKETITILKENKAFLSPSIGLLFSCSPSLLPNVRKLSWSSSNLAKELYYQREFSSSSSSTSNVRYGPCSLINSKSFPATWLSCEQLGLLTGLAVLQHKRNKPLDSTYIDSQLKLFNIHCNYIHEESVFTGISLSRYRKLIQLITDSLHLYHNNHHPDKHDNLQYLPYGWFVFNQFIWEKAKNKEDLLKYLLNVERFSEEEIFHSHTNLRDGQSSERERWNNSQFTSNDLASKNMQSSFDHLLSGNERERFSDALEHVIAAMSLESSTKNSIRPGKYLYSMQQRKFHSEFSDRSKNVRMRPDCVEVVIREIIDNLLFDRKIQRINLDRLPSSAHPKLRQFYENYMSGELTDISEQHITKEKSSKKNKRKKNSSDQVVSEESLASDSSTIIKDVNHTSAGFAWYQLCSNLPDCEYLCSIDDERYELRPSMKNVCRVLGKLLNSSPMPNAFDSLVWNQLQDVAQFWNNLPHQLDDSNHIKVKESRNIYRAPYSDTEKVYRDVGSIEFIRHENESSNNAITGFALNNYDLEIELEEAKQLAVVKYRRADSSSSPISSMFVDRSILSPLQEDSHSSKNNPLTTFIPRLLQSIVFQDQLLLKAYSSSSSLSYPASFTLFTLLSSKWGEEYWKPNNFLAKQGQLTFTPSMLSLTLMNEVTSHYQQVRSSALNALSSLIQATAREIEKEELTGIEISQRKKDLVEMVVWLLVECHSISSPTSLNTGTNDGISDSSSSMMITTKEFSDFLEKIPASLRVTDGLLHDVLNKMINERRAGQGDSSYLTLAYLQPSVTMTEITNQSKQLSIRQFLSLTRKALLKQ
eukprot:gene6749-7272_t